MLLEVVYEGIETAGYTIQQLRGSSTAVYVGQMNADYYDIVGRDLDNAPEHMATSTARSITSNRVSYSFDWTGPSVTMDTACSSSMVAVQQAMQALRNGDSSMAVAAGVNLLLGPEQFVFESKVRTHHISTKSLEIRICVLYILFCFTLAFAKLTSGSLACCHPGATAVCGTQVLMGMLVARALQLWY